MLVFEWDEKKDISNQQKHGVSFGEVIDCFYDDKALLFDDPEHSINEERYVLIGIGSAKRVFVVCHCYRKNDKVIRIISARKATKKEEKRYDQGI